MGLKISYQGLIIGYNKSLGLIKQNCKIITLVESIQKAMRQNLSFGFTTGWDSNQPAQLQRLALKLKFHLQQV